MRLSASFEVKEEEPSLELRAVMYNINAGHNRELMERCRELRDYAEYTRRVREYAEKTRLEEAVERAIREWHRGRDPERISAEKQDGGEENESV